MFEKRKNEKELLDLGSAFYSSDEYRDCMEKLERIGWWLGGNRASFRALANLNFSPSSILDVGCGGGHFTALLAKRYPKAQIVGIDTSEEAIEVARAKTARSHSNLRFEHRQNPTLSGPEKRFDVVTATLLCHHLTDSELVEFIKAACLIAKHAVIFNDLHRHAAAYYFFKLIAPFCFNNRLVLHDGPLSILRAFKKNEWIQHLSDAGIMPGKSEIYWNFAFRWTVTIRC